MDMLITDSSQRPTVMELLKYPIIESELNTMKKEAHAICNSNVNDSILVSNAASTIQIISEIQANSAGIILRFNNLETTSRKGSDELNSIYKRNQNSIEKNTDVEETGGVIQIKPSMEFVCKTTVTPNTETKSNEIEGKHDQDYNNAIQCNKATNRSKNSSSTRASTTASYSYDDRDSTANTKINDIYKSSHVDENPINPFPFQIETVF